MSVLTTFDRLCAILQKDYKLAPDQLSVDAPLEALGIDSLGVADLLFNVEDEFKIILPPEPVNLVTVGDVAGYIDALIASQRGHDAPGAPAAVLVGAGAPGSASS